MAKKIDLSEMTAEVGNYLTSYANVNNELFIFHDNAWIRDEKEKTVLVHRVLHNFEENATSRDVKEVINKLLSLAPKKEISYNVIGFKNVSYDFDHKKVVNNISVIPNNVINRELKKTGDFDFEILTAWNTFINNLTLKDVNKKNTLFQILGDIIEPIRKNEVAIFFIGEGANNGKSTFNDLIIECLGHANTSDVMLENYGDNGKTFARAPMLNKLANFDDECKVGFISAELLKSISGNGRLSVEAKNKDAISAKINATLIHNCNKLPSFDYKDAGILRRMRFLNFEVVFGKEHYEEWQKLKSILKSNDGMECLLALMVEMNEKFDGKIEETELSKSILKQAKLNVVDELEFYEELMEVFDNVVETRKFLYLTNDNFSLSEPYISKKELYDAYKIWCQEAGIKYPRKRIEFLKTLTDAKKIEEIRYNKRDGVFSKGVKVIKLIKEKCE